MTKFVEITDKNSSLGVKKINLKLLPHKARVRA